MKNLLSYCGLVDARISASEKDLPVPSIYFKQRGDEWHRHAKRGQKKPQNKRQLFNSTKGFFVVKKEEKEFEFEGHFLHAKKWILIITIQYSFLVYQLGLWNITKTWHAEWRQFENKRPSSQNWHQNFSKAKFWARQFLLDVLKWKTSKENAFKNAK